MFWKQLHFPEKMPIREHLFSQERFAKSPRKSMTFVPAQLAISCLMTRPFLLITQTGL